MVTHVAWNHTGSNLLTSSDDKSVSLWLKGQSEPVMSINTTKHNFASPTDDYLKNQVSITSAMWSGVPTVCSALIAVQPHYSVINA